MASIGFFGAPVLLVVDVSVEAQPRTKNKDKAINIFFIGVI